MASARQAGTNAKTQGIGQRSKIVWASLAGAMTAVSAALLALDHDAPARLDGLALPPLVSTYPQASLEAIFETRAAVQDGRWRAIVIDHSASPYGTPDSIDQAHRETGRRGLGSHFVIGNGNGMGDGEVHVGYRWLDQDAGAHTAGPDGDRLNRHGIGICLVGDGSRRSFTDAQLKSLMDLVSALAREYDIPAAQIVLHADVAPTDGPGRYFPAASFREQVDFGR